MTVENVLMCAALALIELINVVQIGMMLPIKKHVLIYIPELNQKLLQDTSVLSHTKDTKICAHNANKNHYHDRQSYNQKTMLKYHALRYGCRNHVRYLLDLPNKQFNRTVEPPKPIAFPTDSEGKNQGKLAATAFDQKIYGVWVYSPQSKYKTWIPEASQNKHS